MATHSIIHSDPKELFDYAMKLYKGPLSVVIRTLQIRLKLGYIVDNERVEPI